MPVLIQSKIPPRQGGYKYPVDGAMCPYDIKLDVTSGQGVVSPDRLAFSPMSVFSDDAGYHGFFCFENFWQSGKRYSELGHLDPEKKTQDIERWKGYTTPHRRHPAAKGLTPVDAIYPDIDKDAVYGYVESRKAIYVPLYHNDILMSYSKDRLEYWKGLVEKGRTILVVDYDGPKTAPSDDDVDVVWKRPCLEVTVDLLREKINDTRYPFGHGYVVAAALLGITPDMYTGDASKLMSNDSKEMPKLLKTTTAKIIRVKPKLRKIPVKVDTKCHCCSDTTGSLHIPTIKRDTVPTARAELVVTSVINVKMQSLRNLYGNKYANQLEWEQGNDNHVYIGRGNSVRVMIDGAYVAWPKVASPFANPFAAKKYGREESIRLYREYIIDKLGKDPGLMDKFRQLQGKTLGCWCKPEACHGDVLLELLQDDSVLGNQ